MTVNELLPSVAALSHAEKFRLVQIVLQQLAEEEGIAIQPANDFNPLRYFGTTHHNRQAVDDYLASAREGWNGMVEDEPLVQVSADKLLQVDSALPKQKKSLRGILKDYADPSLIADESTAWQETANDS